MSHDLATPEGRDARLDELIEQGRAADRLPVDTDTGLLARCEAWQLVEEGYAALYRAEDDATRFSRVARRALLDAIAARVVSAEQWERLAADIRGRIAAEGGSR